MATAASLVSACIAAAPATPSSTQQSVAASNGQPGQAKTTVRYANFDWWAFTPGVQWDQYHQQEAFPRFQAEYPHVELVWEPFGGYGSGWDSKVMTQMAAGTAPDVLSGWSPITNIWAEKNQLLDLQPLVDAELPNAKDKFLKTAWEQSWDPINHIRFGLPADVIVGSVYYDKTAFEAAKVALPNKAWTLEEYLDSAEKLTQKDAQGNVMRWGGQIRPDFSQGYFYYVQAFGGQVRDDESMMVCHLDEEPAQQALEWIRQGMWERNCFAQDNQINATGIPDTWTGLLPAKVVAFAERVSDQFFSLAAAMSDGSWNIAHAAQGPQSRTTLGTPDLWSIYQGVTQRGNQDAVWQFTKWLATSDYYQGNIASKAGRIPALASAAKEWPAILRAAEPKLATVDLEVVLDQIESGEARAPQLFRFQSVADELLNPALQQIFVEGKAEVSLLKEVAPQVTAAQQATLKR